MAKIKVNVVENYDRAAKGASLDGLFGIDPARTAELNDKANAALEAATTKTDGGTSIDASKLLIGVAEECESVEEVICMIFRSGRIIGAKDAAQNNPMSQLAQMLGGMRG